MGSSQPSLRAFTDAGIRVASRETSTPHEHVAGIALIDRIASKS